jgi:hypothetical protein
VIGSAHGINPAGFSPGPTHDRAVRFYDLGTP